MRRDAGRPSLARRARLSGIDAPDRAHHAPLVPELGVLVAERAAAGVGVVLGDAGAGVEVAERGAGLEVPASQRLDGDSQLGVVVHVEVAGEEERAARGEALEEAPADERERELVAVGDVLLCQADDAHKRACFAVGLEHGNATLGNALMNTLFLREHNRIAGVLQQAHPDWDDERLFQTTRTVMIVILLKIVIGEEATNRVRRALGRTAPTSVHAGVKVRLDSDSAGDGTVPFLRVIGPLAPGDLDGTGPVEHVLPGTSEEYASKRRDLISEYYDLA